MIDLTTTNILLFLILIMVLWVYMRQYSTSLGRSTQAVETRNIDMEAHLALIGLK